MNLVVCAENCRWQNEGFCTLQDMTRLTNSEIAGCCHFEPG